MLKARQEGWTGESEATLLPSRLLLVDDDSALLLALSGTLEQRLGPCTIEVCESGSQALELLTAHRYDMIISDVTMPGMTGWQFLSAVQQSRFETPVFLMSGNADHAVRKDALEAGAAGFFAKPFDRDEFVGTVREGLAISRLKSMQATEHFTISRATGHQATLVEKLRQHDGASAMPATHTQEPGSPPAMDPTVSQRAAHRSTIVRHLAMLDTFLLKLAAVHRQTSTRLSTAQDTLRRHAFPQPIRQREGEHLHGLAERP